jgi:glycine oxidase
VPQVSDLIIVGGGAVGLSAALAAADRGLSVLLVADHRPGQASWAAAGMLAPSIELHATEAGSGDAQTFALAARDLYPSFLKNLYERTGISVPLNRNGIIVVDEIDEAGEAGKAADARKAHPRVVGGERLTKSALTRLEPSLAAADGARFFPDDGAVDNVILLDALEAALSTTRRVRRTDSPVRSLKVEPNAVTCEAGTAPQLLLAAGAWTPLIEGLPRPLPIHPVRGQMLSLVSAPLTHVVYGPNGYLVPRSDGHTFAGSTMEQAGFDASTTDQALKEIRTMANTLCPPLATARTAKVWAGLRPVTPDFLPIIGRDPDHPSLLYACGHSRNGVLLAPLTADCIATVATGAEPSFSLTPFAVDRFAVTTEAS